MKALRSQSVLQYVLTACLGLLVTASNTRAEGIGSLAQENVGQAEIDAYLDSIIDLDACVELTEAIRSDPRFAKGTPGYAAAIQALVSFRDARGFLLRHYPEQIDPLLDAARDAELATSIRTRVIKRMGLMAAVNPEAVQDTLGQLLRDPEPYVLIATVQTMSQWGGIGIEDPAFLLALATDPVAANPEAVLKAQEIDEKREAEWAGFKPEIDFSSVGDIRNGAATAWVLSESPRKVLDHVSSLNLEKDSYVWGRALHTALVIPNSAMRRADEGIKREWLDLWATALANPECAQFVIGNATGAMHYFLADNPGSKDEVFEALDVIASGHPEDQRLQDAVSWMKERYE